MNCTELLQCLRECPFAAAETYEIAEHKLGALHDLLPPHDKAVALTKAEIERTHCRTALHMLHYALSGESSVDTVHIHVVGDGKAGKSVAVQWLLELLAEANSSAAVWDELWRQRHSENTAANNRPKQEVTIDVRQGRTRGVHFSIVSSVHPATGQPVDYVIHDYGGQEEFLSNHANFMSKDHSLYVIVLPVSEIGGSLSECRVRTLDEIVHRYIFWLRFVLGETTHSRYSLTTLKALLHCRIIWQWSTRTLTLILHIEASQLYLLSTSFLVSMTVSTTPTIKLSERHWQGNCAICSLHLTPLY